ncbi:hypothetical protein CEXT_802291 [Caerostris extrusa]|uniref:Uncharacterized protein n=1 Tax=Caerostris extrusa TaxID=172846 RepID=A0AAV4NUJ0_CAEEX|nr:hypothetical protein CEXT_802291 [Caerostris extrusa]
MPLGKQKDYERTMLHYEISSICEEEEKKRNELSLPLGKNTFQYRNGRLCLALQVYFQEPVGREINFRWLFQIGKCIERSVNSSGMAMMELLFTLPRSLLCSGLPVWLGNE